jgi:UDP-N-acetylmuramate dehydrogenase
MDRLSARSAGVAAALRERIRGELREDEMLARYSTYRIGGPATVLLPAGPDDVSAALRFAADEGIPWFALGLGSNLLLPDEGLDALVVRVGKGLDQLARDGDRWRVGQGFRPRSPPGGPQRRATPGFTSSSASPGRWGAVST